MYIMGCIESVIWGVVGCGCAAAACYENNGGDCTSSSSANWEKTHREQEEMRENIRNNDYNQRVFNNIQNDHIERMQIANPNLLVPGY